MSLFNFFIIASFTAPEKIGTSIAIVYKATKVPTVEAGSFIKEVVVLFGSIVVFIIITALALFVLTWLIAE